MCTRASEFAQARASKQDGSHLIWVGLIGGDFLEEEMVCFERHESGLGVMGGDGGRKEKAGPLPVDNICLSKEWERRVDFRFQHLLAV